MYVLYSFFLLLTLLFYLPPYFVRIKLLRRERLFLKERLGFRLPERRNQTNSLWLHAVSVGEVLSLQNLILRLKQKHPDWAIYFSTLTNTGMRVAREKLASVDQIFFIPLDFPFIVRKFFNILQPKLFILAESEFWPILLKEAKRKTKGVLLINGRISHRSFQRYLKFRFLARKILKNIDLFLVQTEDDKERLEKMGMDPENVRAVSNLKSEIELPLLNDGELARIRNELGVPSNKKIIVAGSTRKGEEIQLLKAFEKAREVREDLSLILAPRHPERFDEVMKTCLDYPFQVKRRTQISADSEWDILVLDTIGELAQIYALGDLAFIGGSLVPWGGHNLLEPAFYRKPIFFGPHMKNFSYLSSKFVQSGAARVIFKEEELLEMFLMPNESSLKKMGDKAKETLDSLQGATEKTINAIEVMMAQP